jgi:hypothetical protein
MLNQMVTCFYWDLLGPVIDKGHSFMVETTASKWTKSQIETESRMRKQASPTPVDNA